MQKISKNYLKMTWLSLDNPPHPLFSVIYYGNYTNFKTSYFADEYQSTVASNALLNKPNNVTRPIFVNDDECSQSTKPSKVSERTFQLCPMRSDWAKWIRSN